VDAEARLQQQVGVAEKLAARARGVRGRGALRHQLELRAAREAELHWDARAPYTLGAVRFEEQSCAAPAAEKPVAAQ
jgi:hypothetical protein